MADDRDLEIFSDDLFKYMLPIRLGVKEYCCWLRRAPEDNVSNFHPHIGMSVLCHSFKIQYCFFLNFLENGLDIQNSESFARYLTNYSEALYYSDEHIVFEKLLMLASVALELSVFYYLQGNKELLYYASRFYFRAFQYFYKNDFFSNGGWNAWRNFVSEDVKFYKESQLEALASDKETPSGSWLRKLDQWIVGLALKSCFQVMASGSTNTEMQASDTLPRQETTVHAEDETHSSKIAIEETIENIQEARVYKIFKDCSRRRKYINKSNQIILDLKQLISRNKDDAYEQLSEIISKATYVKELMRFCIFPDLIDMLKKSELRMGNEDILEFVKLILKGNPLMAVYCRYVVQEIYEQLYKENFSTEKDSERTFCDVFSIKSDTQEANSETESSEHSTPTKENVSSGYDSHKNLLTRFLHEIMFDKPYGATEIEICKILLKEENAETILNVDIFISIMRVTVNNPKNRWENQWLLSVMKRLTNNSQASGACCTFLSTMDDTQSVACSGKALNEGENSGRVGSAPDNVSSDIKTETTQPQMSFQTDHGRDPIETVHNKNSGVEKGKSDAVNLEENPEVKESANSKTLNEDASPHSYKHLIKDLETEALSEIVQKFFKTLSISSEQNVPDTIHAIKQSTDAVSDVDFDSNSKLEYASQTSKYNPLTSTDEVHDTAELGGQCFVTEKRRKKEVPKVSSDALSDLSSQLSVILEEILDHDFTSRITEDRNRTLENTLRASKYFELGSTDFHHQKTTDSCHQDTEKNKACEKPEFVAKSCSSTDKNLSSTVNLGSNDTSVELLIMKPKFHSTHETCEIKVKNEIEEGYSTVSGENLGTGFEMNLPARGDNSDAKRRAKLESEANIQPDKIISEENSVNLKDTNLIDFDTVTNQSALQSDSISAENVNLNTQETVESKTDASLKHEASPDIISIYKNSLSLLPASISSDMSDWIFEQIIENNPDLLEMMEAKYIIDNQLKKEVLKHHNIFKETFKGSKSKSDAENLETDSADQN